MSAYPHTTVEEAARDFGMPGPWWLGCEHPERPSDDWTVWDWACKACFLHLQAAAHNASTEGAVTISGGNVEERMPLVAVVEAAREWREERGLW